MQRDSLGGGARNLRIEDFVAANNHEVIMVKPNRSEAILKKTSRYFGDRLEDSQILREPFQIADRVGMNSMPKGRLNRLAVYKGCLVFSRFSTTCESVGHLGSDCSAPV